MTFSFDQTAGNSQNTAKPRLEGNKIHEVTLRDCKIEDIKGVKDPSALYKVIKFNFDTPDGYYEHAVFEPKPDDFKRGESEFTKDGKVNKIPQPSNVESMMMFFKHVIDGFIPKAAEQIDSGKKSLVAKDWEELRKLVVKITMMGEGVQNKIKLIKNKKGEGVFPGFFTAVNREGSVYVRNNFIGEKVAFTPYEMKRMQNEAAARPTSMENGPSLDMPEDEADVDLDFDPAEL